MAQTVEAEELVGARRAYGVLKRQEWRVHVLQPLVVSHGEARQRRLHAPAGTIRSEGGKQAWRK